MYYLQLDATSCVQNAVGEVVVAMMIHPKRERATTAVYILKDHIIVAPCNGNGRAVASAGDSFHSLSLSIAPFTSQFFLFVSPFFRDIGGREKRACRCVLLIPTRHIYWIQYNNNADVFLSPPIFLLRSCCHPQKPFFLSSFCVRSIESSFKHYLTIEYDCRLSFSEFCRRFSYIHIR